MVPEFGPQSIFDPARKGHFATAVWSAPNEVVRRRRGAAAAPVDTRLHLVATPMKTGTGSNVQTSSDPGAGCRPLEFW